MDRVRSFRGPAHTLFDEGRYLGSVRTMYRLLALHGNSRERRKQLTHPAEGNPDQVPWPGDCCVFSRSNSVKAWR